MSSIASIDNFADSLLSTESDGLDFLVNNAGFGMLPPGVPKTCSDTGVDTMFQTNYLGHVRLTERLMPLLRFVCLFRRGCARSGSLVFG